MQFTELNLKGVYLISPDIFSDSRGKFHRSFCKDEYRKNGIDNSFEQGNISENPKRGTLRGFHYQIDPYQESKTISCITGSIFDVVIDLRKDSSTFLQSVSVEISYKKKESIFIPKGCANAWLTLESNTFVHYYMGSSYHPDSYKGIKFNDKFFNIKWPFDPKLISDKDLQFPDFKPSKVD
tara:strand:+ start:4486 stop:5028 length:543 start_codon:yes stop_codon:yes gene_type:complete